MRAILLFLSMAATVAAQERFSGSELLDEAIEISLAAGQMPGAVLLVGQGDIVLHRRAYGQRSLTPLPEAMTADTIFDAASLTKVVATTACLMKLVEQGKVRLNDRVTTYLPQYQGGKSEITVRLLLTHFSGLRPDLDLTPAWSGYQTGIRKALADKPAGAPGERFVYSDINFLLLGEIVHRVSGKTLDRFALEDVFQPLGMKDSTFNPAPPLAQRIAPTEQYPGMAEPLRGVVHDPTARYMGGG